jgi:pilus assembly protein CpaC
MNHKRTHEIAGMRCWRLLALLAAAAFTFDVLAEPPQCPPPSAALPITVLPAPIQPPRPPQGPDSVGAFVQGVSHNDAMFEVAVGQGRILVTKTDLAVQGKPPALVAVGDPTTLDFAVVSSRQIRIVGLRVGVTDLVITTPDNQTYNFEVRVVADLRILQEQLKCHFPDACIKLSQIRDHVIVEGQARDGAQVTRIMELITAYMDSVHTGQLRRISASQRVPGDRPELAPQPQPVTPPVPGDPLQPPLTAGPEAPPIRSTQARVEQPIIINMIRVPGPRQVLLRVRVAELNRTAFRQIGADFLATPGNAVIGSTIGGSNPLSGAGGAGGGGGGGNSLTGAGTGGGSSVTVNNVNAANTGPINTGNAFLNALAGIGTIATTSSTTAFGIFQNADFAVFLSALRRNNLLRILAEPNLVALDGQAANFLAGGEFPVPIPQTITGGAGTSVTVTFKEFGVKLGFLPNIQDGEVIRLAVDPEVSSLDPAIGTVLVPGGTPVPGLSTRKAHTVVEMREGQTLAIAGLLQVQMDGTTNRIPGLGDLPVIGPFFSNTTGSRIEKELIVLITPHLIEPMNPDQVPPVPGEEIGTPNDCEFYFLNRIEVPAVRDWRATTDYTTPLIRCMLKLDAKHVRGPYGFCDQ